MMEIYKRENNPTSLSKIIFSTFLFFLLMPYVSPIPLETDIQPVFSIFGFLCIVIFYKNITLNRYELIFIFISLVYLFSFSFIETNDVFSLVRKHVNYILVFPVVILLRNKAHLFSKYVLISVIHIYAAAALIEVTLPSLHAAIISKIYNHKEMELGIRGWSGVMPEPTDFGFTCVMLLIFCSILFEYNKISKRMFGYLGFILIILCIGTISGSGLVSLVLVICSYFYNRIFKITNILLLFFITLIITLNYIYLVENYRSFMILEGLITDPMFIIENTSFFYRIIDNIIAGLYFLDSFGIPAGVGGIARVGPEIIHEFHLYQWFPSRIGFFIKYLNDPPVNIRNGFAQLLVELGWIGFIFIGITYRYIFISKSRNKVLVALAFSLMMFQSFPVIYPLCWAMISFINSHYAASRRDLN